MAPCSALNWCIKKKCARTLLLPVPLVEALVMPIAVERTTQKPHAEYVIMHQRPTLSRPLLAEYKHIHKASTVVSFLTAIEIYQISTSQERAFQ